MKFKYLILILAFAACKGENNNTNEESSNELINKEISADNEEITDELPLKSPEKFEDHFKEFNDFPYTTDLILREEADKSSYFDLDPKFLRTLYEGVRRQKNDNNQNIIRAFIEMDSLRQKKVSEEKIRQEFWEFPWVKIQALHKFELKNGIKVYTWYYSYNDGNQGPDVVMATLYKNGKPQFCFQLGTNNHYSDSPVWSNYQDDGEIYKDGKLLISHLSEYGEYDDETDNESSESTRVAIKFQINKNAEIDKIDSKLIEYKSVGNNKGEVKYEDYDAITIGNGLKLRNKPSADSEIIKRFDTGELIEILSKTDKREKLTKGNSCDDYGYYWYQVHDSKGNGGFLYGKFIYKIQKPKNNDNVYNKYYKFGNKQYKLNYAHDLSYGPSDSTGLTGCDMFYLPFFYNGGNKVRPIYYNKDQFPSSDLGWKSDLFDGELMFLVLDSEGGDDDIEEIKTIVREGSPALELTVIHGYQDGSSKSKIYVSENKNLKVVGYEHEKIKY